MVTTIAGGNAGFADGIGGAALFDTPIAITGDLANNAVYIADFNNNKIRKIIME